MKTAFAGLIALAMSFGTALVVRHVPVTASKTACAPPKRITFIDGRPHFCVYATEFEIQCRPIRPCP